MNNLRVLEVLVHQRAFCFILFVNFISRFDFFLTDHFSISFLDYKLRYLLVVLSSDFFLVLVKLDFLAGFSSFNYICRFGFQLLYFIAVKNEFDWEPALRVSEQKLTSGSAEILAWKNWSLLRLASDK